MNKSDLFRLFKIASVIKSNGLDEFFHAQDSLKKFTWIFKFIPAKKTDLTRPRGQRLRESLEQLGPIFVKFGQILSTRPDLLVEDIANELTLLQDKVPPFALEQAKEKLRSTYQARLTSIFSDIDEVPVASASVAQVHFAHLREEDVDVIIKILRPDIEQTINEDLGLLYSIARFLEKYWQEGKRLRLMEVVTQYDKTIHDELDLRREAANASQLRNNFLNSDMIYVPKVYFDYTSKDVMVMERINGISIRNLEQIKNAGIDMKKLGHNGVEIFFTQAFRDGFFHADMHPGNIFVSQQGQYRAVDFGIMGSLSDTDKHYLAVNLLCFFNRDYRGVAKAHLDSGWVPANTSVEEFEAAIRTVCEPIFAKPINEISFGKFIIQLFQTARRFKMPVQPQLVLLQKTLLNIEGLGRQLYPELDLWQTAKPYLESWMNEQYGPKAAIKALKRELPKWSHVLPELPRLSHQALTIVSTENLVSHRLMLKIDELEIKIKKNYQRQLLLFVLASTLGLILIYQWLS